MDAKEIYFRKKKVSFVTSSKTSINPRLMKITIHIPRGYACIVARSNPGYRMIKFP